MIPVFFCLFAAGPLAAEEPQQAASAGAQTLGFNDPRLKATGREWIAFEAPDKFAFMRTMFCFYGLSEETHDVKRAVELLDLMYLSRLKKLEDGRSKEETQEVVRSDALLSVPCHLNFMYILNDKTSSYGERYFLKEGAVPTADAPAGPSAEAGSAL
jgi:hypothetical protein